MKNLEKYLIIGQKVLNIFKNVQSLLLFSRNETDLKNLSQNINYIEVILEKFQYLSWYSLELLNDINSKKNILNDILFNIQYSFSYKSIKDLNNFYEICLNDSTDENLRRYSIAIYILFKIFNIKIVLEIEIPDDNKINEFKMILTTVKNFFTHVATRLLNLFYLNK